MEDVGGRLSVVGGRLADGFPPDPRLAGAHCVRDDSSWPRLQRSLLPETVFTNVNSDSECGAVTG